MLCVFAPSLVADSVLLGVGGAGGGMSSAGPLRSPKAELHKVSIRAVVLTCIETGG